jgi:hypothetical protein
MLFCTYCGKSFTRKEHLERHIPRRKLHLPRLDKAVVKIPDPVADKCYSDTNVMPYRCSLCQLSFPRRYGASIAQTYEQIANMETPEISPNDITLHITKPKTQCFLHPATSPPLLASTVPVRRPDVTRESPARGVQKRTCNARLGLLVEDVHKDPFGLHLQSRSRVIPR